MDIEIFALLVQSYKNMSSVGANWQDRYTPEGQKLLCKLRDIIANRLQLDPMYVQGSIAQIATRQEYQL